MLFLIPIIPVALSESCGFNGHACNPTFPAGANPPPFSFPETRQFCKGSRLAPADGTQNKNGFCSSQVLGDIPSVERMPSCLILSPQNGAIVDLAVDQPIVVRVKNLETGYFEDPLKHYYNTPQTINDVGIIQGHVHVVVQKIVDSFIPPSSKEFAFFKGLNEVATEDGRLSVVIPANTLSEGKYRLCTIAASRAHLQTILPVAQRGSVDDCIRFTVKASVGETAPSSKL